MTFAAKLAFIFFGMILVNNYVFSKFLGVIYFGEASQKPGASLRMGLGITAVMVAGTAITWPLYTFLLQPFGFAYLNTLVFVIVIVLLVQLASLLLRRFAAPLYQRLGNFFSLIIANCAVLGVALLAVAAPGAVGGNATTAYTYPEALVYALGAGLGLTAASLLFAGLQRKLQMARPPKAFRGMPLTLVAA
ncbi:MAG: electron transport complex protein RnfA, partial [Oscillospiraceae bacterium]